jgi:hypothetical protein
LPLHLLAGTQLTLAMRTEVTCRLALPLAALEGEVPPLGPAAAGRASAPDAHSSNPTTAAVRNLDRLWAPVLAKRTPFATES